MPNSIHDFEAFRSDLTHIKIGTIIPKPKSEEPFIIKGWGIRRGEKALIYFIPNHNNASRPYEKGITLSEWEKAFNRLLTKGEFSRDWFNKEMASCKDEGGCNFTTIGGIFILSGVAQYEKRGVYKRFQQTNLS